MPSNSSWILSILLCLMANLAAAAQDDDLSSPRRLAVSDDHRWIAVATEDSTVKIWDAARHELKCTLPLQLPGTAVAFSPNGERLLVGTVGVQENNNQYYLGQLSAWNWQADPPQELWRVETMGHVMGLAVEPNGHWVAANFMYASVAVHELESGRRWRYWQERGNPPSDLAIDYTGKKIATAGQAFIVWEPKLPKDPQPQLEQNEPLDADASKSFISGLTGGAIACVTSRRQSSAVAAGAFSGKTGHANDVAVIDLKNCEIVRVLVTDLDGITCLGLSPDEKSVAVGFENGAIRLYDPSTKTLLNQWQLNDIGPVRSLSFLSDNQIAVTGFLGRHVVICDSNSGKVLVKLWGN